MFKKTQPKVIKDSYFGEMGLEYDKLAKKYYLDKEFEIAGIPTVVIIYFESSKMKTSISQQRSCEIIIKGFIESWKSIKSYLVNDKKLLTLIKLKKDYRIESVTIPEISDSNSIDWEMDLLNLKDGFSRIVIGMINTEPKHFSVEA